MIAPSEWRGLSKDLADCRALPVDIGDVRLETAEPKSLASSASARVSRRETRASLDLDVGGLEDLPPALVLFLVEGAEGGGRHLGRRRKVLAEVLHAATDVGILQGGDRGGIEPGDDLRRR